MLRASLMLSVVEAAYECKSDGCHPSQTGFATQNECFVACLNGYLWPQPKQVNVSQELVDEPFSDCWTVRTKNKLVKEMAKTFQPHHCPFRFRKNLHVHVNTPEHSDSKDESYSLHASSHIVTINASSPRGARHAMSTLSQLIVKTQHGSLMSKEVHIDDKPSKSYRGVMVDTSRHFFPVHVLKRIVKGMGMAKLNSLHLHLTDAPSFPLFVPQRPDLSVNGTFSSDEIYSRKDIEELVKYAELFGVDVIPEIDAPAHVGKGWPEDMVVCNTQWEDGGWQSRGVEPPTGQLNIANEKVYDVFKDVYTYLREVFPSGVLHLGGDEVVVGNDQLTDDTAWPPRCWNSTHAQPILDFIEVQGLDRSDPRTFYGLWENFTRRSLSLARDAGHKEFLLWAGYVSPGPDAWGYSQAQQPDFTSVAPPEDVTVMVWDTLGDYSVDPNIPCNPTLAADLTKSGYNVILAHSDYAYMDCGSTHWVSPGGYWCSDQREGDNVSHHVYNEWYKIYQYMQDARSVLSQEWDKVRGAQVLSWSENADEWNTEQRIWPRAAALAEALWSDPKGSWYDAAPRLLRFHSLLSEAQIPSNPLQPEACERASPNACFVKPAAVGPNPNLCFANSGDLVV